MCKNYQTKLFLTLVSFALCGSSGTAETRSVAVTQHDAAQAEAMNPPGPADDLVYWKQYLFSIPYRLNRTADAPDAPTEVRLLVSTDQGQKWSEVSRVGSDVRGFTYYAPRDGEYWFSLQTVDRHGNTWPASQEKPKLRVVVDTHAPKLLMWAEVTPSGSIAVVWQTDDANLAAASLKIEMQTDVDAAWKPVDLNDAVAVASRRVGATGTGNAEADAAAKDSDRDGRFEGRTSVPLPPSATTIRLRATVSDRAGNLSETSAEASVADRPDRTAMLTRREPISRLADSASRAPRIDAVSQSHASTAIGPSGRESSNESHLFAPPKNSRANPTAAVGPSTGSEPWPADAIVADRDDPIKPAESVALSIDNPYAMGPATDVDPSIVPERHTALSSQSHQLTPPPLAQPPRAGLDGRAARRTRRRERPTARHSATGSSGASTSLADLASLRTADPSGRSPATTD